MARWPILKLIEHLRHSAAKSTTEQMSDVRLIQRFAADRDEAAFEVLVQRYGPMVFGVCLRVLGNAHDAEDAFQATFLVLAKKARSLARQELVGNWLWGVAYRTAKRAQADAARWHARERQVRMAMEADPVDEVMYREIRSVLDEEIKGLPTKYRQPFVLCYLEGKTNEEAARKLGCPTGTVFTRLAQARELLRSRLTRRGVKLSSATLAAALTREVTASVPMGLVSSTVKAAALFAAGNIAVAVVISTRAVTLAEGGLRAMFISKIKVATAVVLTTVTLGSASTLYGYRMLTDGNRKEDPEGKRLVAIVEKEPPNALMANQEFEHSNKASLSEPKDGEVDADSLDQQAADDDNNGGFGFGFGSGSGFGSGQGMGFGMGSSSGGSKLSTLSQKPVQRELTLSDKQLKKVRELQSKQQRAMRAMAPKNPLEAFNDPGATMKEMQQAPEKMKKLTKEIDAAIDEMLTEKQSKRLREICLQQQRGHALDDPEVTEALKITAEQRKQIRDIQAEGMQKMQELGFQTMGNLFRTGPNPAAFQKSSKDVSKRLQQIWDDTGDQLLGILTSEQKSKWNELIGKPFKASSTAGSR